MDAGITNSPSLFCTRSGRESRIVPILVAVVASLVGAFLIYLTNASFAVILGLSVGVIFLVLLGRYLELGIYVLLGASLLLEQFQIFGMPNILTLKIPFYLNLNLITGIGALVMNPVELLLGLIVGIWFVRAVTSRETNLRVIPNLGIAVVFLGMLIFFTGYGLAMHGDFKSALWEIRALYYLCAMYFLASQLIRTRRQVTICIWIIIIAISIKGLQGCWRFFITLGGHLGNVQAITGHEDALFMSTIFVLMLALFLLDRRRKEFWVLLVTFPFTFLTFIVTQRRIAYGVFALSVMLVILLVPRAKKILALKLLIPIIPFLLVYTAVFWNSSSTLALPVQQVRSVFQKGEQEDTSNTYRKIENFNLKQTIRTFPQGIGFGKKYLIIIPLADVDFPLWEYIPHNCIYWMWAKTGFVGFVIFWLFVGTAIVQAVINYRKMNDLYFRAVSLMVITFIISQVIVAYYDLQITFYRNMIYLGTSMGLLISMGEIETQENESVLD